MNIDDTVVYYYIVKSVDYIKVTEQYKTLYNDVINHISQLPKESQQYLYKYIEQNLSGCDNHWAKLILEYIKQENRS